MKWFVLLLFAGCHRAPEPPLYILTQTVEREGVTVTRTFQGPTLPTRPLFSVDFGDIAINEP